MKWVRLMAGVEKKEMKAKLSALSSRLGTQWKFWFFFVNKIK
jgi:hypothetical protein